MLTRHGGGTMGRGPGYGTGRHFYGHRRTRRALLSAALVLALLLPAAGLAQAATFTVSTTQDAPHTTPLNGNCTSTLPGNPCTLRAAVQAANFLGGTHTINLQVA